MQPRIGIFGGSFNPIHVGHIAIARELLTLARLNEVWFLVSPLNPFKKAATDLLDDDKRLLMAQRALRGEARLKASDYEFHLPKPSYTWNTLRHLKADYPDKQFVLIIGADNWLAFDRWARPDFILAHYPIIVYPREGYAITQPLPEGVRLVDTPLYPVSSTEVRRRVKAGEDIAGLVPPPIESLVKRYYNRRNGYFPWHG